MKEPYQFGKFILNFDSQSLLSGEDFKNLKEYEFKLLEVFSKESGTLIESNDLFRRLWNEDKYDKYKLDKLIFNVRKLLAPFGEQHIITRPGVGYVFMQSPKVFHEVAQSSQSLNSEDEAFKEFFGNNIKDRPIKLVFAFREVKNEDCIKTKNGFKPPSKDGIEAKPEGIDYYIPTQDTRAAVYVSNLVSSYTDQEFIFVEDEKITNEGNLIVSFGLGWNTYTTHLTEFFNKDEFIKYNEPYNSDR